MNRDRDPTEWAVKEHDLMWKKLALAILAVWILCTGPVHAQPVRLDPARGQAPLSGHLEWLEDSSGRLTVGEVDRETGWQRLPGMLNVGFTQSAIWLRWTVENPESRSVNWVLSVDNVLADDVRVYTPNGSEVWREQRGGRAMPHSDWPLQARVPSFELTIPPGLHTVHVRLEAQHSLSGAIHLQTPDAFRLAGNREALVFGIYMGVYTVVAILQLFFWLMGRGEKVSGWYLVYTLTLTLGTVLNSGYPQNFLNLTTGTASTVFGLYLCLAPAVIARLTAVWLEMDRSFPSINRWYQGTIYACTAVTCGLVLADRYGLAVEISQSLTLLWVQVSFGLGIALWAQRRSKYAGYYLVIFGFIDLGLMARFMRNLGILPVGFVTDYALFIGISLHLIAMSLYFIHRFRNLESTLQLEQQARAEQREFVAMVSHEFRTPLAIINTSIQQLAANLDAPPEKSQQRAHNIRQAIQRMSLLLDDYLSLDRLDSGQQPIRQRPCDLYEVLEEAASDWPVSRIRLAVGDIPDTVICDPDLVRIALRNLLSNADRHSPPGAEIELSARTKDTHTLWITVHDRGEGIPADEQARLFQKYFRGRGAQGKPGAGLGLYLVQRIVTGHGGRITVHSAPGEGTAFDIELPIRPLT